MAEKRYLFTPGPTPVPPEVLAELAKPIIHHRERDYREIYQRCLTRLQEVYRTKSDVLMFTTSGTGAFESAVANLTSPGDRQLVLSAGNFGERWAGMARAFGADLVHARLEWGETPEPDDLRVGARRCRRREGRLSHALGDFDRCRLRRPGSRRPSRRKPGRWSSSTRSPASALCRSSPTSGESTSSCPARRRRSCAHPASLSSPSPQRALAASANATAPRYVMDWERTRKGQAKLDAPFTPAVSLVRALDVALGMLLDEGLEAAFDRHARLGRACREGAKAMGLELFSPDEERSAVVTAIRTPDGVDSTEVVEGLVTGSG